MGLADYIKRVDQEEEEGQFQTDIDLSAYSERIIKDEVVAEYKKRDQFEIHGLLFENQTTGYCQCTLTRCQEKLKAKMGKVVWMIQEDAREGVKPSFLLRHLRTYHRTAEEERSKLHNRSSRSASQPSMIEFTKVSFRLYLRVALCRIRLFSRLISKRKKLPYKSSILANPGNKIQNSIRIPILIFQCCQ